MSALPSSRKTHNEKHKQILRQLLKEPANKTCVDCKTAQHPRWASWNLGCFICIRCSGIHRSMGTHISRVKSLDLDVWTDEQVESMVKWGNEKCNLFWEAKLPHNYVPDASKIENFIRTKYDMKKWTASSRIPDPMTLSGAAAASLAAPKTVSSSASTQSTAAPKHNSSPAASRKQQSSLSTPSLLDDEFGSFSSSSSAVSSPAPTPEPSRPVASHFTSNTTPKGLSSPSLTGSSNSIGDPRNTLKKSILSLYSSPSSSSSNVPTQAQQSRASPQSQSATSLGLGHLPTHNTSSSVQVQNSTDSALSLSNSLLGLSFGSEQKLDSSANLPLHKPPLQTKTQQKQKQRSPAPGAVQGTQWHNEWNDSSSSASQWSTGPAYNGTSASGTVLGASFSAGTFASSNSSGTFVSPSYSNGTKDLEDELFKNVWS